MKDLEMILRPKTLASLHLPFFLALGLLLGACGVDQSAPPKADSAAQAPAAETPPPVFEIEPEKFQIRDGAGEVIGFVTFENDLIRLVLAEGDDRRLVQTRLGGGEHRYNERGVGPVALVEVDLKSFVENFVLRSPSGEFRYRAELRADRALAFDHDPKVGEEVEPFIIRRAQDNFLRLNRGGESLGSVLINDKGQVRVKDGSGELLYKVNGVENFTTAFGLLLLPDVDPMDRMVLLAELHLLERRVSAGAG